MNKLHIITILMAAFVWISFSVNDNKDKSNQGYKVGDMAEDFKLRNVDNKFVSLSQINAKGYVIVFTCNHCPYSIAYEDRLIALDKKYKPQGFPLVAINPNDPEVQPKDSFEAMQQRAKEKGFTFPYLFDEGQKVYPMYGATRTPHVFLLKKTPKGNEVVYIGAIDDNHEDEQEVKEKFLENAIEAVIRNEKPSPEVTKAIGCTIKTQKKQ